MGRLMKQLLDNFFKSKIKWNSHEGALKGICPSCFEDTLHLTASISAEMLVFMCIKCKKLSKTVNFSGWNNEYEITKY